MRSREYGGGEKLKKDEERYRKNSGCGVIRRGKGVTMFSLTKCTYEYHYLVCTQESVNSAIK